MSEKIAKILVECGYATDYLVDIEKPDEIWVKHSSTYDESCNPYTDTLEGRRQADVVEDWLLRNAYDLWYDSKKGYGIPSPEQTSHQWRLDRTKWCIEQLGGNNDD